MNSSLECKRYSSSHREQIAYCNFVKDFYLFTPTRSGRGGPFISFLCDKLQHNDPDITQIIDPSAESSIFYMEPTAEWKLLGVRDDFSDVLGESFLGNNQVTNLCLDLANLTTQHADQHHTLLKAIWHCTSLRFVVLRGHCSKDLNHSFLHSISCNKVLEEVRLYDMTLDANSLTMLLLGSGRSMKTFQLQSCELMEGSLVPVAVTDLLEHKHLLSLHVDAESGMLSTLQKGIESHPNLRELIIGRRCTNIAPLCAILESPHSALQHLMLVGFEFTNQTPFAPIARSILANQTVTKLSFGPGAFFDTSFVQHLVSIYQSSTSKVQSLGSDESSAFSHFQNFLPSIYQHQILGLKELDLLEARIQESTVRLLPSLFAGETALERCKLSWLEMEACQALIQVLPLAHKVKELTLGVSCAFQNLKQGFLHAFEKNSSLVKVDIHYHVNLELLVGVHQFDESELTKIHFYTKRNEMLTEMLLEAPFCEVPLSLYPRLFCIAKPSQIGLKLILQCLLQLEDVIGLEGEQRSWKRRRTTT